MEIVWSPLSINDLEEIGDFIAQDNPDRAVKFVDELITSVERLVKFPESGQIVEENPIFRQVVYQGYRLIYQFRSKKILIITVLGPGRTLKKR
ncbi:MAG: type II toxin-antitoxin system RelE/ParE family toxin [Bdellovibrionales bacterium]|nr:type II toxin-antitoxin system RelE/ParE family toxin [Bdellovibrionales bacterium]